MIRYNPKDCFLEKSFCQHAEILEGSYNAKAVLMSDALFAGQTCGGALSGSPRALQHNLHIMTDIGSCKDKRIVGMRQRHGENSVGICIHEIINSSVRISPFLNGFVGSGGGDDVKAYGGIIALNASVNFHFADQHCFPNNLLQHFGRYFDGDRETSGSGSR